MTRTFHTALGSAAMCFFLYRHNFSILDGIALNVFWIATLSFFEAVLEGKR